MFHQVVWQQTVKINDNQLQPSSDTFQYPEAKMSIHQSDLVYILRCQHATCTLSHTISQEHFQKPDLCTFHAVTVFTSGREKNKRWPECGSVSGGASGLPPPAPFLTFCHTFGGGHISSSPQPNYSTTHLAAIKRCTAGVRGSCVEPGCCHGHCHSADFQGWKANAAISHRKMLVVLFWPTGTGAALKTITDTVAVTGTNRICTLANAGCSYLLTWTSGGKKWMKEIGTDSLSFAYLVNHKKKRHVLLRMICKSKGGSKIN